MSDNVGSSRGSVDNNKQAKVSWLGLAAMARLDTRVTHEDKCARFEVVVLDCVLVVLNELGDGLVLCLLDLLPDLLKVFLLTLELSCLDGQELTGCLGFMYWGEVGGFGEVEWKD